MAFAWVGVVRCWATSAPHVIEADTVYEQSSTFSQWATMWMHVTRLLHTPITNTIATTINSTYMLLAATEVSFKRRYECITTKWCDNVCALLQNGIVIWVRHKRNSATTWVRHDGMMRCECVTAEWYAEWVTTKLYDASASRQNGVMSVRHDGMVW